jgi:hypothetical protein
VEVLLLLMFLLLPAAWLLVILLVWWRDFLHPHKEIPVYEGKKKQGFLSRLNSTNQARLIYSGRCDAPLWAMVQSLETMITVRKPMRLYPLSRYWLDLGEADYLRGQLSANLDFVEKLVPERILFFNTGKSKAVTKNYGFIWSIEEILLANRVELIIEVFWKDLSGGEGSEYEEQTVLQIAKMTRETVQNLDSKSKQQFQKQISPPPPMQLQAVNLVGPPPAASPGARAPSQSRQSSQKAFSQMSRSGHSRPTNVEQTRRLIEWPSPQDYQESIQNPQICFTDERLSSGEVDTDAMGMPRVSSGAFASVYRVKCADGDRAVRCFLQPIKDQEFRYKVLSDSIKPQYLPWTVNFEYLPEGIRVGKKWYPILAMDWVEGTPLNLYVADLCYARNTAALKNLRSKFAEMVNGLRIAAVAHGDLQHGNILVKDGRLVLVDYDGMYVPGLRQQISNELGHPNYQHPRRSDSDFSEIIDHFSAWIIDTALLCLAEDPTLWRYSFDDGESMLFHRHDFIQPEGSQLMTQLFHHPSQEVRQRAQTLSYFLKQPSLDEIPALNLRMNPILAANTRVVGKTMDTGLPSLEPGAEQQSEQNKSALPDWIDDIRD